MDSELLQAINNIIELKSDKRYLFVFKGAEEKNVDYICERLRKDGIQVSCIGLQEGQDLSVIEYPAKIMEEYTDEQTGTRLIIDRDIPKHPRVTAIPPEGLAYYEDFNEAVQRLFVMAGLTQPAGAQPPQGGQK